MWFFRKNIDGVHAFYLNGLLRSLFMSMTTIFIPVYVYTLGMRSWGIVSQAILLVVLYFVVQRILIIVIVFPLSKLIEKYGFRKSISTSVIFLLASTASFLMAEKNLNWLWASTIFMGINIPLYWISRDSALSQDIARGKMGSKMSYIVVLENIAGLLGPFAGGAMVLIFGYPTLFMVAILILLLSIIPLWWMSPHSHKNGVSLAGFKYFLSNGRNTHQCVANFGSALNDYGNGIIWPLILFLQGISHEKLGGVYSLVAIVAISSQYVTGKWFDKLRSRNDYADEGVYGFAAIWVGLTWIGRIFAQGIGQIIGIDLSRQILGTVYTNFYVDYLHLGGKRMGSIAFWVYMEVIYSMGAIFIFGVMAIGVYFGIWKELTLITISLWSLATIVMARESNMR